MSKTEAKQAATQYLKDQAEIMRRYGAAPKLSGKQYEDARTAVTRTFKTISNAK
jgi:hypothetical protein